MRKIRIDTWCDYCWLDGEQETPAVATWTIGLLPGENMRPSLRLLETCELHSKAIVEMRDMTERLSLIDSKAAQPARPVPVAAIQRDPEFEYDQHLPPSSQPTQCPVCHLVLSTKQSCVNHVWSKHSQSGRQPMPLECPDCDATYENGNAAGIHRRFAHGYDALDEALSAVKHYRRSPAAITTGR